MRLRDALLILSAILVIGCHSHASGPLVVVQCPGPEIDEPQAMRFEDLPGGVTLPYYGSSTITTECRNGYCGQDWQFYDGLAESEIDVE